MQTVWDWVTLFGFAGLITLFLQRSTEDVPRDKLWQYAPPSIACGIANYLGNHDYQMPALAVLGAAIFYVVKVLKFPSRSAL